MLRLIRPAAYAWIVSEGRVLLCRLCEPHNAGQWTLPGGGLEFGEDVEAGCRREVFEETGLTVRLEGLLSVDTFCSRPPPAVAAAEAQRLLGQPYPEGPAEMYSLRIVYIASVAGGTLTQEREGTTDLTQWIPLPEVRSLNLVNLAMTVLEVWETRGLSLSP